MTDITVLEQIKTAVLNKEKKAALSDFYTGDIADLQKLAEELETVNTHLGVAKALVARYKALRGDMN